MIIMVAVALIGAAFITVGFTDDGVSADPSSVSVSTKEQLVDAINNAVDGQVIIVTADIEIDTTLHIKSKITLTAQSPVKISASGSFVEAQILDYNSTTNYVANPGMIYVDGNDGKGSLTLGENTNSPLLTIDGKGKARVIYNTRQGGDSSFNSLIIYSAKITGGHHDRNGGGIFNTHGAGFEMYGGEVSGNTLNTARVGYETMKYSTDIWNGSGARLYVHGGSIDCVLQNTQPDNDSSVRLDGTGHIGTVYVVYHKDGRASTFYYDGGTVDHVLLSSKNNLGVPESFTHMEVYNPQPGNVYKPSTYEAVENVSTGTKYNSIYDAVEDAQSGDRIKILGNIILGSTLIINKEIRLVSDSAVMIKAADDFREWLKTHSVANAVVPYPGMIFIDGSSSATTQLILGESTTSPLLTIDANGKCRVINNETRGGTVGSHVSLTINSAKITNGMLPDRGAGVFNTYMGQFVMNGGEITGNSLSGPETRYKYATDIFNGSGAQGWINGGKIGSLFQHSTEGGQKKGKITIDGGNIDSAYLDYPLGDALSTLIYNNGTLGKLMMETSNNGGTFNPRPSNILDNPSFGEYHSGDVVLLLETGRVTGYGNIQDAHDAADDSKNVLMLLMDSVLPEPLRVTKTITLKGSFTITPAINDAFLNNGAMILLNQGAIYIPTLTLAGPTIDGNGMYRCVHSLYANLVLESGLITNGRTESNSIYECYGAGISLYNSTFKMLGGCVEGNNNDVMSDGYFQYTADIFAFASDVTISGGTVGYMAGKSTADVGTSFFVSGDNTRIGTLLLTSDTNGATGGIYRAAMTYSSATDASRPSVGLLLDHVSKKVSETPGDERKVVYSISEMENGNTYYGGVSTVEWFNGDDLLETDEPVQFKQAPKYDGNDPVRDLVGTTGYEFVGWHTDKQADINSQDLILKENLQSVEITNNTTYYAIFKEISTYAIDGNIVDGSIKTDLGRALHHKETKIKILPDADHVLPASVTVSVGNRTLSDTDFGYSSGIITIHEGVVDGDIVVTAACPLDRMSVVININDEGLSGVRYKVNNGDYVTETASFNFEVDIGSELILEALMKDGYVFSKWANASGSGSQDNPYEISNIRASIELFPQTKVDAVHSITFLGNGGSPAQTVVETDENGRLSSLPEVVRDGYTFVKWKEVETGNDVTESYVFEYDAKVEAVWELNSEPSPGPNPKPNPEPSPGPNPKPTPKPQIITVTITFEATEGGQVDHERIKVPLNSKLVVNGDALIIGSGANMLTVKASASTGFMFASWSTEDCNLMSNMVITAEFKAITMIGIAVEEAPIKMTYTEGETFDPSGLVILAGFDNMSSHSIGHDGNEELFTFSVAPHTPLTADHTTVTVYFNGHSAELLISVLSEEDSNLLIIILVLIATAMVAAVSFYLVRRSF